jgi:hypothetical protein
LQQTEWLRKDQIQQWGRPYWPPSSQLNTPLGARSNKKKRPKTSIKQSRRMLKRLRRGVSNKRVGQLKSKYSLDVEDVEPGF